MLFSDGGFLLKKIAHSAIPHARILKSTGTAVTKEKKNKEWWRSGGGMVVDGGGVFVFGGC